MKKVTFILFLLFSNSVFAVDKDVENIKAVCLSPDEQGKY